jgi:hypothetical protein
MDFPRTLELESGCHNSKMHAIERKGDQIGSWSKPGFGGPMIKEVVYEKVEPIWTRKSAIGTIVSFKG